MHQWITEKLCGAVVGHVVHCICLSDALPLFSLPWDQASLMPFITLTSMLKLSCGSLYYPNLLSAWVGTCTLWCMCGSPRTI